MLGEMGGVLVMTRVCDGAASELLKVMPETA